MNWTSPFSTPQKIRVVAKYFGGSHTIDYEPVLDQPFNIARIIPSVPLLFHGLEIVSLQRGHLWVNMFWAQPNLKYICGNYIDDYQTRFITSLPVGLTGKESFFIYFETHNGEKFEFHIIPLL